MGTRRGQISQETSSQRVGRLRELEGNLIESKLMLDSKRVRDWAERPNGTRESGDNGDAFKAMKLRRRA